MLQENEKQWLDATIQKIKEKMEWVSEKSKDKIPYTTADGTHDDRSSRELQFSSDDGINWWTNGFWGGMMWLMHQETGEERYADIARISETKLDRCFHDYLGLHHDVGFMWLHSAVADYRLTGNPASRTRGLIASNYLSSRFNIKGKYIVAWDGIDRQGWSIIDTMMNIPLLYWAAEETGYDRYRYIAMAHADKTLENILRPDGSVVHIICYDPETGEVKSTLGGQGYEEGSSWTRGQAWAIYGFALSYLHTGEKRYLDAAKRVANYFLSAAAEFGYIPPIDFRSPKEPNYIDTTAGAIAACGLIELEKHVPEFEKEMYLNGALKILKALTREQCNFTDEIDSLLQNGSEAYHTNKHLSIIYGDYFYMEAMLRLNGLNITIW